MTKFGLLGRKLSHSYSPAIHKELGSYPYELYEVEPEDLERFLLNGNWSGLNVTIPYKKDALSFCHELSVPAKALGSVNTLLRKSDGTIFGDNTDYYGFWEMARSLGLSYKGKKALVLGSGGASVTVQAVLRELGCHVVVISRTGENNYSNLSQHRDASILVNTTPVGMYPHNGETPLSLQRFTHLEGVMDVIYNPCRTALILQAEKQRIPCVSGLKMLVYQAARASEQFTGKTISREKAEAVYKKMSADMENIILIGMPGCGKSTLGKLLAEKLGRPFYDADAETEKLLGMSIPQFFAKEGEAAFREAETTVLCRLASLSGAVIATGGGCVTKEENYDLLHQNGKILWVKRQLDLLSSHGRPVSQRDGVNTIYEKRKALYQAWSDLAVENDREPEAAINHILEGIL